jgi:transcriptional regulator with XRE-family HTH domain
VGFVEKLTVRCAGAVLFYFNLIYGGVKMAKSRKELEASLSPKKQKAAWLLVQSQLADEDTEYFGWTQQQIADEVGVSRMQLWRYQQESDFIEYKAMITRDIMNNFETEVMAIFKDALRSHKSFKGIELYFKYRGLLKEDKNLNVNIGNGTKSNEEMEQEIAELEKLVEDDEE